MKTKILGTILTMIVILVHATNWTNYPSETVPQVGETFLVGSVILKTNLQVDQQNILNWTRTNVQQGVVWSPTNNDVRPVNINAPITQNGIQVTTNGAPLLASNVVGTTSANSAAAGYLGEFVISNRAVGSALTLSTATAVNVTNLLLQAGDWDVRGVVFYTQSTATTTDFKTGISTTSATFGSQETFTEIPNITTALSDSMNMQSPTVRISISSATTVYLVAQETFTAGGATVYGTMTARRVR